MSDEPNAANMLNVGVDLFFDGHQYWLLHDGHLLPCDLRTPAKQVIAEWEERNNPA